MTEDDKKLLTEYLGECWHKEVLRGVNSVHLCCDCYEYNPLLRTFNTWQDLGDLKGRMVEKEEWHDFEEWVDDKWGEGFFNYKEGVDPPTFLDWLLNPARFCQLVADWRKENP